MNDRLKFRAWVKDAYFYDEDENKYEKSFMIYGVAVFEGYRAGHYGYDIEDQLKLQGFSEDEIEQFENDWCSEDGDDWYNFDADEIEQCTGLKDKNGKLIFEGDIVSCLMNRPRKGVVEYHRNAFSLNENGSYSEDIVFSEKCCQVIGNIHENPELLK